MMLPLDQPCRYPLWDPEDYDDLACDCPDEPDDDADEEPPCPTP